MNFSDEPFNAKPTANQSASAHLIVMGISYHNCPIFVREKFVIPESCVGHALGSLARMPHINEAAILSTCNRTEVYAVVSDVQAGMKEIESFFLSAQTVNDHEVLKPNFRLLRDDVALHLFRVASGLDSMVLGEGQIMSQVKAAYKNALESGTAGPILGQLFQLALNCGKRVRTETSMGKRAVSVSSAAVELARHVLGPLKDRTTLIIGAGKMAQICGKHVMSDSGDGAVIMINRTGERIEHFAGNKLPNKDRLKLGLSFDDRHQIAAAADLVIVATSAPKFLLEQSELKKHLQPGRTVTIVDISVPRNVDPTIGELDGVSLYDADNLVTVVNKNIAERESLIDEAEQIVMDVLLSFHEWERSLLVAPTITELRKKIEAIREEHLIKIERKQTQQEGRRDEFEDLSRALINQILHHPTTQLKSTSDYRSLKEQAEALRKLFNLDILSSERSTTRSDKTNKERSKANTTREHVLQGLTGAPGIVSDHYATATTRSGSNQYIAESASYATVAEPSIGATGGSAQVEMTRMPEAIANQSIDRSASTVNVKQNCPVTQAVSSTLIPSQHTATHSISNTQPESAQHYPVGHETAAPTQSTGNIASTVWGFANKALSAINNAKQAIGCPFHAGQKSDSSSTTDASTKPSSN